MLTMLRRIVLEFGQEPDLDSALRRMVKQVKHSMSTDCCSVYLADYQNQHFKLMASDGLARDSLGQTSIGFSEGLVGLVGQREEPINIADAHNHPQFLHAPEVEEEELRAFLGTPIIHQRKVLGILSIQQKDKRSFTENEEAFLVTLSAQLATALANAEARGMLAQEQDVRWSKQLLGIPGAPGITFSPILVSQPKADLRTVTLQKVEDKREQIDRFEEAIEQTRDDFEDLALKLSDKIADDSLDIFDVYKQLLDSTHLADEISAKINFGWCAESALKQVVDNYVIQFESIEDGYLRERASDIKDLGNRLLFNLQQSCAVPSKLPENFILLSEDVSASMLAEYQHKGLQGIISLTGSNNSHAAILARAIGLPAIMGIEQVPLAQLNGQKAILDGYSGELFIDPNETLIQEYKHLIVAEAALSDKINESKDLPSITTDGKSIELFINAGLASGFEQSQHEGVVGIGLYRTEIPFMNRSCFPSETEQSKLYQDILKAFPEKPVVMRTLDVGGDKSLPYFPISEDNPFLGWRGLRITLDHPEIFLVQVRAMMRANRGHNNLEIMLPMVSTLTEVDDSIRLLNQAYFELSSELKLTDGEKLPRPRIGIMIEVPSTIFILKELSTRVDFFSVGSNDLTQYLLAVDRNNARVSNLYDSYHPSVLRALYQISKEASQYTVPLSLCGELASEPAGAILLLAMGYDKLSMNPHSIAKIKWVIRHVDYQHAKKILEHTLTLTTAKQVHSYLNEQLEHFGLGGFIRAGS